MKLEYRYADGGRRAAGYEGSVGDCAIRAFCNYTGAGYDEACAKFSEAAAGWGMKAIDPNRVGGIYTVVSRSVYRKAGLDRVYAYAYGDVPVRLSEAHAEFGDCIVETATHCTCIIGGIVYDTWRFQRDVRCLEVYAHEDGRKADAPLYKAGREVRANVRREPWQPLAAGYSRVNQAVRDAAIVREAYTLGYGRTMKLIYKIYDADGQHIWSTKGAKCLAKWISGKAKETEPTGNAIREWALRD